LLRRFADGFLRDFGSCSCACFSSADPGAKVYWPTLIATAKVNEVDPQAWLADILARMLDYPPKRIGDLLPWNWHAERRAAA